MGAVKELLEGIKIILRFALLIFVIYAFFNILENNKQVDTLNQSQTEETTIMKEYESTLSTGLVALQVYSIRNEATYQEAKQKYYLSFDVGMREMLFPTSNFTGYDTHPLEWEVLESYTTSVDEKTGVAHVYIKYRLQGVNYDQTIENIVTITSGLISNIERI